MKFVACRSFRNVPKLDLTFNPEINPDIKPAPPEGHIPKGCRFEIGKEDVIDNLSPENKQKVLHLSFKGGANLPAAIPVNAATEKMVALIDAQVKAEAETAAKQSKPAANLADSLEKLIAQNATLIAKLAGAKN